MYAKITWGVLLVAGVVAALAGVVFIFQTITAPVIPAEHPLIDYKNMAYTIDGQLVELNNGIATSSTASGGASSLVTKYFGDNIYKDLNGDGVPDTVFIVTQQGGGSGTFYYVLAAVSTATSSVGSQGYLLGDRIAPQMITSGPGASVTVTYADRSPTQDFSMPPSEGKSVDLTLDPATLTWNAATTSATTAAPATTTDQTVTAQGTAATTSASSSTSGFSIHAIPLGDGHVSSAPRVGYVYACDTNFRSGGASHSGSWLTGNTWDLSLKPTVLGNVLWPEATFSTFLQNNERQLQGNGLPVNTPTGVYPIAASDQAYQYDHNPNAIHPYSVSVSLPEYPTFASSPSCVPMGPIGYALNGVAIFNALDDGGRDAVAHEIQDSCSGHPQSDGTYHYHGPSPCIPHATDPNTLVGYALDGFGIYSQYKTDGSQYTDADLDACHGTTSPVMWNGRVQNVYHYVMTAEYPYTVGCFRGVPVRVTLHTATTNSQPTRTNTSTGGGIPPPAAESACQGATQGAICSFKTPQGTVTGFCRVPQGQTVLACVP